MTPSAARRQARQVHRGRQRGTSLRIAILVAAITAVAGAGAAALTAGHGTGLAATPTDPAASALADAQGVAAHPSAQPGTPTTPASSASSSAATATSPAPAGRFPHGLLIADRGNARILAVTSAGHIFWRFPVKGSLPAGLGFAADDAFVAPDGKTVVANDEYHQVIYRIDIKTHKVVWQYGHYGVPGRGYGYLHNPDDAYPLANGDVVVADIVNCRVLQIAPDKHIVRTIGQAGRCNDSAPSAYGDPNGDTPLPDGGLLITEIHGSRVVRLSPTGKVLFDIHVPVAYPSDAQIDSHGDIIVVDYSNPGAVVAVTPKGKLLWRYAPKSGAGRMAHPSLGTPLPDGTIVINDDARDRIIVLDPRTMRIVISQKFVSAESLVPGR